ncbi:MAG: ATP-dependent RNA helicase HrpA [Desulfobacterales bacterium]
MQHDKDIETYLREIESRLPGALHRDRHAVLREIRRMRKKKARAGKKKAEKILDRLYRRISESARIKQKRLESLPNASCNRELPIVEKKDEIIEAVSNHQVVIVSGETGSGKTTQLPKFCLEAGRGKEGRIGCTQPRRIAAVTVANRLAEELGQETGQSVGYKIRFSERTSEQSAVKIMTDGILLAETQADRFLNEYDTLIIDEAHERSLNIDFLLGLLRNLLSVRKDLKLIVTSATIDTEKFSKAFDSAPVIEVSGRMYPVEVRWMPPGQISGEGGEYSYIEAAAAAMDRIEKESAFGDVLVFMPTERDIRETCEILEGRKYKSATVLPLYARLAAQDQARVFKPASGRKIVVATNVAETSITIPGIRYVIDTGLARISTYNPGTRTTALPISPISRSSADQRMGRCGRMENGICIRLYSEEDYLSRQLYTSPEILRANLAEVILRMISLKLGEIRKFPFIDPPPQKQIKDGFDILFELGAIEGKKTGGKKSAPGVRLTEKGRAMARMPLDPRLSRMLIEADKNGCLGPVAVIAAALSVIEPRERPEGKEDQASQVQGEFADNSSDFITLYNIFRACTQNSASARPRVRAGELKRFCKQYFLSFKRMREWLDVYEQIVDLLEESGFRIGTAASENKNPTEDSGGKNGFSNLYAAVHKSVLSGFLSNIARKKEKNIYEAAKQREVMIFPGSALFNRGGQWIVAAEIVETTRRFARTAACIDPAWLEPMGGSQCKYTYLNPRWEKKREAVVADEQVSLYGLIIVPKRTVPYGKIDPGEATEIFIRNALIEGDVKTVLSFMEHNWRLADSIRDKENRIRRRELLTGEAGMMEFYRQRLEGVYDMSTLKAKIKKAGSDDFLRMSERDLMAAEPDENELLRYPDTMILGEREVPCVYRFSPGSDDDGVTICVPASAAGQVQRTATDWVVPGLLEEKITALIRTLPKAYRRQLVPVSDTVSEIMKNMPMYTGSLISTLSRFIYERFGVDIPASAWNEDELADYLKLRFSLLDPEGREIASGRDRRVLEQGGEKGIKEDFLRAEKRKWERFGIIGWDIPDLPETITVSGKNGQAWPVYPALSPADNGVDLLLFTDRQKAGQSHKKGVAKLFALYFAKTFRQLLRTADLPGDLKGHAVYFKGADAVADQIAERVKHDLFAVNIRTKRDFQQHAQQSVNRIVPEGAKVRDAAASVIEAYHEARQGIYKLESRHGRAPVNRDFLEQMRGQLARLVPENFIMIYTLDQMAHIPRYIRALLKRAERGIIEPDKEMARAKRLKVFEEYLNELIQSLDELSSDEKRGKVEEFFWMIEEFKVSLFAQELKTALPVSEKRLTGMYQEIRRMV